jgi:hypothetical protein
VVGAACETAVQILGEEGLQEVLHDLNMTLIIMDRPLAT